MSVDNQLLIEDTDLAILQLNIRGLGSKIEKLKKLLAESFKNK